MNIVYIHMPDSPHIPLALTIFVTDAKAIINRPYNAAFQIRVIHSEKGGFGSWA